MDPEDSQWYPYIMRNNSNFRALGYYASLGLPTMDLVDLYNRRTQDSYGQIGLPSYSPHVHGYNEFIERPVNASLNAYGLSRYSPISKLVENLVPVHSNNEFKESNAISSLNSSSLPKSSPYLEVVENHVKFHGNNELIERSVIASDLNASGLLTNSEVLENHVNLSMPQISSLKPSSGVKRNRITWTEEEHRHFLVGLQEYGQGNWKAISEKCVLTKTHTQVASHAQKYLLRQKKAKENQSKRLRASIHDTLIPEKSATVGEQDKSLLLNESHIMPLEQHQQTSMPINAQPEEITDQHIHAPPMTFNPNANDIVMSSSLCMEMEDCFRVLDTVPSLCMVLEDIKRLLEDD